VFSKYTKGAYLSKISPANGFLTLFRAGGGEKRPPYGFSDFS